MYLLKNTFFWISTAVFLVVAVGTLWLIYPSLLQAQSDTKNSLNTIDDQISAARQKQAVLTNLNNNEKAINDLYANAKLALPATIDAEDLTLQLQGLVSSLGLSNVAITAPFQQASVVSTQSSTTTTTSGQPTPSSQTSTGPVATGGTGSVGSSTFSLQGDMDFATAQKLLGKLHTLVRWNKIISFDIAQSSGKMTVNITAQVGSKPAPTADFSGSDSSFLTKATAAFGSLQTYSTTPDITKEGSYGRSNPFANP